MRDLRVSMRGIFDFAKVPFICTQKMKKKMSELKLDMGELFTFAQFFQSRAGVP
ncbi:MAG: hypothetical protein J6S82_04660 [Bacteroidales bacterium]|nr:hypothetical protein [Bacteroidales bacterium]